MSSLKVLMHKYGFRVFAGSCILLLFCLGCGKNPVNIIDSSSVLSILLTETNDTCFTDSDLEGYAPSTHEIALNAEGIGKWNSYIPYDSSFTPPIPKLGKHYQKEFIVKIDDDEIYRGTFTSGLSSTIFEGVVIQDIIMRKDAVDNRFQIDMQSTNGESVADPRNDPRIIRLFRLKNKLLD